MFIRKKRHRFGNIGVIVVEKIGGKMKELATIGVAYSEDCLSLEKVDSQNQQLCGSTIVRNVTSITMK